MFRVLSLARLKRHFGLTTSSLGSLVLVHCPLNHFLLNQQVYLIVFSYSVVNVRLSFELKQNLLLRLTRLVPVLPTHRSKKITFSFSQKLLFFFERV